MIKCALCHIRIRSLYECVNIRYGMEIILCCDDCVSQFYCGVCEDYHDPQCRKEDSDEELEA